MGLAGLGSPLASLALMTSGVLIGNVDRGRGCCGYIFTQCSAFDVPTASETLGSLF